MKSNMLWQYAAYLFIFLILSGCKKDINQIKSEGIAADEGLANSLTVTCIPNGIQFFKTESLSQARSGPVGIGLANKVLFAYGYKQVTNNRKLSSHVDIYNTSSDSWTHRILPEKKSLIAVAAAGTKIGIAGGDISGSGFSDRVDIYDVSSDAWTVSILSTPRANIAGVGYGNFLYFAGGADNNKTFKRIDVYNTLNDTWNRLDLSVARKNIAAAATDNKILFAGGLTGSGGATDRVDIYDVPSGTWSLGAVSKARAYMVGAALGNIIIFGGGYGGNNSADIVDVYNTTTKAWSSFHMYGASFWEQSAVQGTKMFFSGSRNVNGPTTVDVYDVCDDSWSTVYLSSSTRYSVGAGAANNKVLFGGGWDFEGPVSNTVDIFNIVRLVQQ